MRFEPHIVGTTRASPAPSQLTYTQSMGSQSAILMFSILFRFCVFFFFLFLLFSTRFPLLAHHFCVCYASSSFIVFFASIYCFAVVRCERTHSHNLILRTARSPFAPIFMRELSTRLPAPAMHVFVSLFSSTSSSYVSISFASFRVLCFVCRVLFSFVIIVAFRIRNLILCEQRREKKKEDTEQQSEKICSAGKNSTQTVYCD